MLFLLLLLLLSIVFAAPRSPPIPTMTGPVVGTTRGEHVWAFLGVPYAEPPTSKLRWMPPRIAKTWDRPFDASEFGPACPQLANQFFPATKTSEDCLTLNIWTPATLAETNGDGGNVTLLPVMIFLHGGAFLNGVSSQPTYDGTLLAQNNGVVVASCNYRLGPLGFLAHASLSVEDPLRPGTFFCSRNFSFIAHCNIQPPSEW